MARTAYLFMEFDGVTHPWGEAEDFRCLPLIEAVVREFPELRIVVASDRRMVFPLSELAARFAEDVRPRMAGATVQIVPRGGELRGLREREAMAWLEQHEERAESAAWCAIDHAPGMWLTPSRVVLTDFKRGFGAQDADALRSVLRRLREAQPEPAPLAE